MSKLKNLKEGNKVYQSTRGGLILSIFTIIGTTEELAMSKDFSFVKKYSHEKIRCLDFGKGLYHHFSIETEALKNQWRKQVLVKDIMLLVGTDLELRVLENILKILKTKKY